jgi:hypothetical protein
MPDRAALSRWELHVEMTSRPTIMVLAAAAGWLMAACTTAPSPAELGLPKVELPKVSMPDVKLPDVKLPDVKLPKVSGPAVGSPTEVYTRVARGALLCWFGGNGPLKGKYIYHADAEPPSKGGRADIGIHAREARVEGGSPRGNRVYHIGIAPVSDRAEMTAENFGLPDALALQLQEDAQRWAASEDEVACRDEAIAQGWDPKEPSTVPPARKAAPPAKTVKAATRG